MLFKSAQKTATANSPRFIPTMEQVALVASTLPDASRHEGESKTGFLRIEGKNIPLTFTRSLIKSKGEKKYQWLYEGKVIV